MNLIINTYLNIHMNINESMLVSAPFTIRTPVTFNDYMKITQNIVFTFFFLI